MFRKHCRQIHALRLASPSLHRDYVIFRAQYSEVSLVCATGLTFFRVHPVWHVTSCLPTSLVPIPKRFLAAKRVGAAWRRIFLPVSNLDSRTRNHKGVPTALAYHDRFFGSLFTLASLSRFNASETSSSTKSARQNREMLHVVCICVVRGSQVCMHIPTYIWGSHAGRTFLDILILFIDEFPFGQGAADIWANFQEFAFIHGVLEVVPHSLSTTNYRQKRFHTSLRESICLDACEDVRAYEQPGGDFFFPVKLDDTTRIGLPASYFRLTPWLWLHATACATADLHCSLVAGWDVTLGHLARVRLIGWRWGCKTSD